MIIKYMNVMRPSTTRTKVRCKSGTTLEIRVSMRALTSVKLRSHGRGILRTREKKIKQEEQKKSGPTKRREKEPTNWNAEQGSKGCFI